MGKKHALLILYIHRFSFIGPLILSLILENMAALVGSKEPRSDPALPLPTDGAKVKRNTALREKSDQRQGSISGVNTALSHPYPSMHAVKQLRARCPASAEP